MKDYPDEQITILNNAFFHKKIKYFIQIFRLQKKSRECFICFIKQQITDITKLSNLDWVQIV